MLSFECSQHEITKIEKCKQDGRGVHVLVILRERNNRIPPMCYGSVERAANVHFNSNLLQLIS